MEVGAVSFQAFKDNQNNYILKEFVIVSDCFELQIMFRSPYSIDWLNEKSRRTADWLVRNYHSIDWDDGEVRFTPQLLVNLLKNFKCIHTRGTEKTKFLKRFHRNVVNIEYDSDFSNTDDSREVIDYNIGCLVPHHNYKNGGMCALRSARGLYKEYKCIANKGF